MKLARSPSSSTSRRSVRRQRRHVGRCEQACQGRGRRGGLSRAHQPQSEGPGTCTACRLGARTPRAMRAACAAAFPRDFRVPAGPGMRIPARAARRVPAAQNDYTAGCSVGSHAVECLRARCRDLPSCERTIQNAAGNARVGLRKVMRMLVRTASAAYLFCCAGR